MKKEVGDTLIDMGSLYESKGNYDEALKDYKESLQIQQDANDENYQALCLNNIGGVYLTKGDTGTHWRTFSRPCSFGKSSRYRATWQRPWLRWAGCTRPRGSTTTP